LILIATTLRAVSMDRHVSTKVRRELKEEARKQKLEELKKKINEINYILEKIDTDRVVKHIRETREGR